jgi:hypothetical protein
VVEGPANVDFRARYGIETDPSGTSRILEQFNLLFPSRATGAE